MSDSATGTGPVHADNAIQQRTISRRSFLRKGTGSYVSLLGIIGSMTIAETSLSVINSRVVHASPDPVPTVPLNPAARFGYFHGAFTVNSLADVEQAAASGINYVMNYGDSSVAAADPSQPLGQALLRHRMWTFLNLEAGALSCTNGTGTVDTERVTNLVSLYQHSPLVAGYWIKDDDCGDERQAVLHIARIVRSIDTNPAHLLIPGFGDAGSVQRNYADGMADVLGFYPYPAYSRGPATEVPEMLQIVHDRTPGGKTPPPFIGIYQAFANPPDRPLLSMGDVLVQAQVFLDHGAAGLMAFGWEADTESQVASNTPLIQQEIQAVTQLLIRNNYGKPPDQPPSTPSNKSSGEVLQPSPPLHLQNRNTYRIG